MEKTIFPLIPTQEVRIALEKDSETLEIIHNYLSFTSINSK